MNSSRNNIENP